MHDRYYKGDERMVQIGDMVEVDSLTRSDEVAGLIEGSTHVVIDVMDEDIAYVMSPNGTGCYLFDFQYTIINEQPLEPVEGSEVVVESSVSLQDDTGNIFNAVNGEALITLESEDVLAAHDYHSTNQQAESEDTPDMVNHPKHYTSGGMETIDKMEFFFGTKLLKAYCTINAYKYDSRAGLKGDAHEDNEKSTWYINKARELQEKIDRGEAIEGSLHHLV